MSDAAFMFMNAIDARDALEVNATDQPCEICGKPNSPFGYGPPAQPYPMWRCGEHRLEGPVVKRQPDPVERMIGAWIEQNWPKIIDPNTCRYCGRRDSKNLIPLGLGPHPIWLHPGCADAWRTEVRRRAIAALVSPRKQNTAVVTVVAKQLSPEEEVAQRAISTPPGYTKTELETARRDAERLGYGRRSRDGTEP